MNKNRIKEFREFLENKNCFKLICGANKEDYEQITKLVYIYSSAGCKFFDINASYNALNALKKGLELSKKDAFICVSIGVDDDVHFSKCKINKEKCSKCRKCTDICIENAITKEFTINENKCIGCQKCTKVCNCNAIESYQKHTIWDKNLLKDVDCVEFHIASNKTEEIYKKWEYLCSIFDGVLSISINRKYYSDTKFVETLKKMLSKRTDKIIIQSDGNSMTGGNNDYISSLQAIACADLVKRNFNNVYIILSGGTNALTKKISNAIGINVNGIAIGSYARKLVTPYLNNSQEFNSVLKIAKELVDNTK